MSEQRLSQKQLIDRFDEVAKKKLLIEKKTNLLDKTNSKGMEDSMFLEFTIEMKQLLASINNKFRQARMPEMQINEDRNEVILSNFLSKSYYFSLSSESHENINRAKLDIELHEGYVKFAKLRGTTQQQIVDKHTFQIGVNDHGEYAWFDLKSREYFSNSEILEMIFLNILEGFEALTNNTFV